MRTVIINYGAGNVRSVQRALARLGHESDVSADPKVIAAAERVIFPGVGQASAAMQRLGERGLDKLIPRLTAPVLGICLGMQLMCETTEEGDTRGLGIFPLDVLKIPPGLKVPHMGWNRVTRLNSALFDSVEEDEYMYFVHSYYVPDNGYSIAECRYHEPFAAAISHGNFHGCQFHPEKSADAGLRVLSNFMSQNT